MARSRKTQNQPKDAARISRRSGLIERNSVVDRMAGELPAGGDWDDKIDARASLWEQMKACDLSTPEGGAAYDRLEAEYDELDTEIEGARGLSANVRGMFGSSAAYVRDRPLAADQTFRGAVQSLGLDRDDRNHEQLRDEAGRELSFGAVLRNAMDDNRLNVVDSMSGGSDAGGGYLVPSILTADIVDKARNKARVLEAGARVVPMANRKVEVPTWETDPEPEWRAENAVIAEDDGELGSIELNAHSLAVIVKASRELLEDTNVDQLLLDAFASSFALKIDTAALYGTGANTPTGLKTVAGVTKTPLAANGASPTWDALVDSVGRLRDKNYDPNAQLSADRTARTLAKLKETGTGAYVQRPGYLDDVPLLTTGQVPSNLTVGTSNDTTDVFTGEWSKLYVGIRTNLTISRLVERYADTGQVGFVAWFRGDIVPARPAAFDVVTGVRA